MKASKFISFVCCFCLVLGSIITVIDYWCFNNEFYNLEYSKLNTASSIGMSNEDLFKTTDVLLSYLKDPNKTLDIEVNVKGEFRQVFNERERAHMEDVRDLYLNVITIRNISFLIFALGFVMLLVKKDLRFMYLEYKKALFVFLFIFSFIGVFCLIDFDSFWTNFHYIFFPGNDLWLLDPRKDILIMMVPSKFFFDLCVTIVFSVFVVLALIFIVMKILDKKVFNR